MAALSSCSTGRSASVCGSSVVPLQLLEPPQGRKLTGARLDLVISWWIHASVNIISHHFQSVTRPKEFILWPNLEILNFLSGTTEPKEQIQGQISEILSTVRNTLAEETDPT